METRKTALERAFELAETGNYRSVPEINRRLRSERLDPVYNEGKSLKQQLNRLIEEAKH